LLNLTSSLSFDSLVVQKNTLSQNKVQELFGDKAGTPLVHQIFEPPWWELFSSCQNLFFCPAKACLPQFIR
jgi:hypothetical protein